MQRRRKAGRPPCGHDMAGADDVITQRLRRTLADKDPARVSHSSHQRPWLGYQEAQVLRCVLVGQGQRFLQVVDDQDGSLTGQRFLDDRPPGQRRHLPGHLRPDLPGQPLRRRDQ